MSNVEKYINKFFFLNEPVKINLSVKVQADNIANEQVINIFFELAPFTQFEVIDFIKIDEQIFVIIEPVFPKIYPLNIAYQWRIELVVFDELWRHLIIEELKKVF